MFMNFQTVAAIKPRSGATGTWETNIQLIPHPISFGAHYTTDSVGVSSAEILNSQLTGTDHGEKCANWTTTFRKWRLAYCAVTIYQDGPALADQGTVVCCQKPMDLQLYSPTVGNVNGVHSGPTGYLPAWHILADELPNYNVTQAMPNAYFGQSKEGVYVPLKLSPNHQVWHGRHDMCYSGQQCSLNNNPSSPQYLQLSPQWTNVPEIKDVYPFTTLNNLHFHQIDDNDGVLAGTPTVAFCNDNWADICFRNLAVTTSLSLFFRFGFECQVDPVSLYSPQLKLSPEYDMQALATYFQVARALKDGYPSDHNDLGKIWSVIKSAASAAAPILSFLPGGSVINGIGKTMGSVVDKTLMPALAKRAAASTRGNTASQADLEALSEAHKKKRVVDELVDEGELEPLPPRRQTTSRPQTVRVSRAPRYKIAPRKRKVTSF